MTKHIDNIKLVGILLRVGLGFVFLYAAISALQHPLLWVGFVPNFFAKMITATTLIKLFAIFELLLVVWLVSGKFVKYCGLLAAVLFFSFVAMNPGQLITTFRDVGLAFMGLALFLL